MYDEIQPGFSNILKCTWTTSFQLRDKLGYFHWEQTQEKYFRSLVKKKTWGGGVFS